MHVPAQIRPPRECPQITQSSMSCQHSRRLQRQGPPDCHGHSAEEPLPGQSHAPSLYTRQPPPQIFSSQRPPALFPLHAKDMAALAHNQILISLRSQDFTELLSSVRIRTMIQKRLTCLTSVTYWVSTMRARTILRWPLVCGLGGSENYIF